VLVDVPPLGRESLKIREDLRRECLVQLDQAEVLPLDARALERGRDGKDGRLQELPAWVYSRNGIRANVGQWLVSERARLLLAHQQHRGGAVGKRRGIGRGHGAVAAIEHGLELR